MSRIDLVILLGSILFALIALAGARSAYRNGVTDGYGFAKEPRNPGYSEAGHFLKKAMSHRWPELLKRDEEAKP